MRSFLVTTSLKSTWPKNQEKIFFLGQWCKLYKHKNDFVDYDYYVFPYHWDDRQKIKNDYIYLNSFYEGMLCNLSEILNKIHCVDKDIKFWRILIGPWLFYFLSIIYDRVEMIQYAVNHGRVTDVILLNQDIYENVASGMQEFNTQIVTDEWNELIYSEIIKYYKFFNIHITNKPSSHTQCKTQFHQRNIKNLLIEFLSNLANKISLIIGVNNSFFIISSSMGKIQDLKLRFKLNQLPRFWRNSSAKKCNIDTILRSSVKPSFFLKDENTFEKFANEFIFKFIPSSYLEGFNSLLNDGLKTFSNKVPALIYTTLSFQFDDKFKAWTANQILDNHVPFVVGQHGGNFGMSLWNANEDHQLKIADYFLSWGWKYNYLDNILPVANLKTIEKKIQPSNRNIALMIGLTTPRYSYHMLSAVVSAGQWERYFKAQTDFVANLTSEVQNSLTIRVSPIDYEYSQDKRWLDCFPFIKLDYGTNSLYKELKHVKIFISTYNSTSFLETMALNVPTLLFWDKSYWECNEAGDEKLKFLENAGILFSNPSEAAQKLNNIWDNVNEWWFSDEIQFARKLFCNTYSRAEKNSLDTLSTTLLNISHNHN